MALLASRRGLPGGSLWGWGGVLIFFGGAEAPTKPQAKSSFGVYHLSRKEKKEGKGSAGTTL